MAVAIYKAINVETRKPPEAQFNLLTDYTDNPEEEERRDTTSCSCSFQKYTFFFLTNVTVYKWVIVF